MFLLFFTSKALSDVAPSLIFSGNITGCSRNEPFVVFGYTINLYIGSIPSEIFQKVVWLYITKFDTSKSKFSFINLKWQQKK